MKKIISSLVLALAMSMTVATGGFAEKIPTQQYEHVVNKAYENVNIESVSRSVASVSDSHVASSVSELESIVNNELDQLSTQILVTYSGDFTNIMSEMKRIISQYMYEHDYFRGVVSEWTYGYKGNEVYITLVYLTTPAQESYIQSEVESIVSQIISPTMSDVEKVKAIHDYVVLNSTYSQDTTTTPHAAYALLNEGKGVCQAYALLTYRLLQEAGMDVRYVTGHTTEDHAWNLVKVDGEWYHLDTTWDDPVFSGGVDRSDYVSYEYFLISDTQILADHTLDRASDYPSATSDRFVQVRGMTSPVEINRNFYYANEFDNIQLYRIDLFAMTPQAQKVSSTRVQYLTYVNDWLYFANYSNGAYLYKMRSDGSNETLLKNKYITAIKQVNNELLAYSNDTIVYREAIKQTQPINPSIARLNEIATTIQYVHPSFKATAEEMKALVQTLTPDEYASLPQSTKLTIATVDEKYDQMLSLSFPSSTQWKDLQTITQPMKPWTIKLSKSVLATVDNEKQVEIVDMFGEPVATEVTLIGNTIIVQPLQPYVVNVQYVLVVKNQLLNEQNQSLTKGVHVPFVFSN